MGLFSVSENREFFRNLFKGGNISTFFRNEYFLRSDLVDTLGTGEVGCCMYDRLLSFSGLVEPKMDLEQVLSKGKDQHNIFMLKSLLKRNDILNLEETDLKLQVNILKATVEMTPWLHSSMSRYKPLL